MTKSNTLRHKKVMLLKYTFNFPKIADINEQINTFFEEIVENYENYLKNTLFTRACSEYDASDMHRKHLHFPAYIAIQNYKITYDNPKILSVILDFSI